MKTPPFKKLFKSAAQHQVEFSFLSSLLRSKILMIMIIIYLLLILGFIHLVRSQL